jgi:hypothetical protein
MHDFRNGFEAGATVVWIYSVVTNAMPPYTGGNYLIKWLNAVMHIVGANFHMVHVSKKDNGQQKT